MPTYSKETALFDTGKIGNDINDAAGQVNKYITQIGDTGIKVHPYDSTNEQIDTDNYTKIDANGMEVYQDIDGTSTKVASFGSDGAQIGQSGASHLSLVNDKLDFVDINGSNSIRMSNGQQDTITTMHDFIPISTTVLGVGDYSLQLSGKYDNGLTVEIWFGGTVGVGTVAKTISINDFGAWTVSASGFTAHGTISYSDGVIAFSFEGYTGSNYGVSYFRADYNGYASPPVIGIGAKADLSAADIRIAVGYDDASGNQGNCFTVDSYGGVKSNVIETGELSTNILVINGVVVDYITEQSSSGAWFYRKWHSGKIEAWFEGTFSCAASTTARGALYYSTWSLSIPNDDIGFTATPNTLIGNTGDSNTVIAVNGAATSKTAMSGKVWRYASSSSALTISARIYAWQN